MISIEVCANSVQSAIVAQKGEASRIELCSNLECGGITPSMSQIELTRENISIPLNVLIRPRSGDFLYDDIDFEAMKRDIVFCGNVGCDGVVFGLLDAYGNIDYDRNLFLVDLAKKNNLSVTFHRAFDRANNLEKALLDIIAIGCDRLLTSGGETSAHRGRFMIKKLVDIAQKKITIMAGSGINKSNVLDLIETTGVSEIHGSFQSQFRGSMIYRNNCFTEDVEYYNNYTDINKLNEISNMVNI